MLRRDKERHGRSDLAVLSIVLAAMIFMPVILTENISLNADAGGSGDPIFYVGGSGAGNYTKIQDAIDNASSGDTVFVYNGTYYENIVINKSINLIGENRDGVIINGSGNGDVIYINETSWVNMSNFTVTDSGSAVEDGGIDIFHSQSISVENVNASRNEVGIYIQYSSHNVMHANVVTDNDEKGILMISANIVGYHSANNHIYNNTISNNIGGGIDIELYSENNFVYDNICNGNGYYGIYIEGDNNLINDNNFSNNDRHGIRLLSNGNNITNNTCNSNGIHGIYLEGADYNYIYNNTCSYNQYGIYVNLASKNNNISASTCVTNSEAGIYTKEANNNIIWGGIYQSNKYGISLYSASGVQILHSTIISNEDGIMVAGSFTGIEIHYNSISGNTKYGVNNTVTTTVNAEHNWWGDVTGPYDPSNDTSTGGLYNPGGLGDNVTDYVDYYPWWDSATGAILPEITDNTPGTATTGDSFTFNASVVDNIAVSNVYVEYWYGSG
ncbi:MAG: hypothetical protein DRN01_05440, partial [Thermoplasmata archaeon]